MLGWAIQHSFSKPSLVNLISNDVNFVYYLSFLLFISEYTASNLGLLLQKEQKVKWGEGPSGKQAVGKTMEHGKLCWHIFNHK